MIDDVVGKPWPRVIKVNPKPGILYLWQELDAVFRLFDDGSWTVSPATSRMRRPTLTPVYGFSHHIANDNFKNWEFAT